MGVVLRVRRVGERGPPLDLPRYETDGAAGMDLRADEPFALAPGARPAWRSRSRPATRGRCAPAPGSPPATASRS
jgi:hypothetical protein